MDELQKAIAEFEAKNKVTVLPSAATQKAYKEMRRTSFETQKSKINATHASHKGKR